MTMGNQQDNQQGNQQGDATGADILAVVEVMREAARRRYGVELTLEQVVI